MNARSAPRRGIAKDTLELLKENPKELWTWADLLENLPDANEKAVQNCIHRLYVEGKVKRHLEDEEDTRRKRYAIEIPPSKCDEYVKTEYNRAAPGTKRKKAKTYSSREIRTAFAQAMNYIAQLEDMVSTVVEMAEDTDKKMKKIENLLR